MMAGLHIILSSFDDSKYIEDLTLLSVYYE